MPKSRTRTAALLLAILALAGFVGQMDYEDEVKIEQANAKQTEVAKQ